MPPEPRGEPRPSPDSPVSKMMDITASGYYCRIKYRKGGKEGISLRVIEPRQLTEGPHGMMVRAIQIEPEQGLRSFSVHKILQVEQDERELPERARKGNNFCTGEVVAFESRRSDSAQLSKQEAVDTPESQPVLSLWSRPWFSSYLSIVREALLDLQIDEEDRITAVCAQQSLGLRADHIRAAHSFILAEELLALSADGSTDQRDDDRIRKLMSCLSNLGWAPGA